MYQNALNTKHTVENRCKVYKSICWKVVYRDHHQGLQYASEYYSLAIAAHLPKHIAAASHYLGISQMLLGNYDLSNTSFTEGLEISLKTKNFYRAAMLYADLGNLMVKTGKIVAGMEFHEKCLKVAEEHHLIVQKARAKINISQIYENRGDYKQSLKTLQEALLICKEHKLIGYMSSVYESLGDVFLNIKEFGSVEKNYKLALKFAEKTDNSNRRIHSLTKLAKVNHEQDSLNIASNYYKEALEIASSKNFPALKALVLSGIASTKLKQHKLDESLKDILASIALFEAYDVQEDLDQAYLVAAQVYTALGRKKESTNYYQKCYYLAFLNSNFKLLNSVTKSLAVISEDKGNQVLALKYYKEFIKYNGLKRDDDDVKELIKLELKANYRNKVILDSLSKNAEIMLLKAAHSRSEAYSLLKTYLAYAGIGILFMILIFGLYFFEQKKRVAVILVNKNRIIAKALKDKGTLLNEVHHRVKNNMQVVSSLLKLKSMSTNNEFAKVALVDSQKQIESMLLAHQKLHQKGSFERICIVDYCRDIVALLLGSIKTEKDVFMVHGDTLLIHIEQVQTFGFIINELITNSLKHAWGQDQKKRIELTFQKRDNEVLFEYLDNGKGMATDFNIKESKSYGTRLIYSLVKRQLLGNIGFYSKNGIHIKIKFDAR